MQRVVGEMYWLILTDTFLRTEDKQKKVYTVLSFAQTYSLRLRLSQQERERGMKLNSYFIRNSNDGILY